ncbi:helix-turn-helix domain-containing protein [Belnapia sp. T18]|uniref:Helix-turn-helix domain-containing protein n=1 Tax=Belnapia arida TaxID=2804533 RepID=A0ABS1U6B7_9PROT|nr:helix-turn-helix domain-containing protein [Belnapia arida]MBL6080217.1 helix-turn-helix domain-containing protein [Belnapia arida]
MNAYHSAKEVAERFGISECTLGRWREEGEGPPYLRLGRRRVAYAAAGLAAWVAGNTHPNRIAEMAENAAGNCE